MSVRARRGVDHEGEAEAEPEASTKPRVGRVRTVLLDPASTYVPAASFWVLLATFGGVITWGVRSESARERTDERVQTLTVQVEKLSDSLQDLRLDMAGDRAAAVTRAELSRYLEAVGKVNGGSVVLPAWPW